ncbi:hypothetical protein V6N13_085628 [Hibiscus sabdariffa]
MNLAPQSSWNIMPTYGSYNQYSNASFSQLPTDGASLMSDSHHFMAGNNNIMHASRNLFMAGYSQQVFNGASPMAGAYVQGMNEAPLMSGNNNTTYAPTPACPMAGSYKQAITFDGRGEQYSVCISESLNGGCDCIYDSECLRTSP